MKVSVRVGKEDHAAYLWKQGETHSQVKWTSTLYIELVENTSIRWVLSPRRRRGKRGQEDVDVSRATRLRRTPDRFGEYNNDESTTDTASSVAKAVPSASDDDTEEDYQARGTFTPDDTSSDYELDRKPPAKESVLPRSRGDDESMSISRLQTQDPACSLETQRNESTLETLPRDNSNSARTGNVTKAFTYSGAMDSSDDEFDYKQAASTPQDSCSMSKGGRVIAMGRSAVETTEPMSGMHSPQCNDQSPSRRGTLSTAEPTDSSDDEADCKQAAKMSQRTLPVDDESMSESLQGANGTNESMTIPQLDNNESMHLDDDSDQLSKSKELSGERGTVRTAEATDSSNDEVDCKQTAKMTQRTIPANDESISESLQRDNEARESMTCPQLENNEPFQTSGSVIHLDDDSDDGVPQSRTSMDKPSDLGLVSSSAEESDLSLEPKAEFSSDKPAYQKVRIIRLSAESSRDLLHHPS